MSGGSARTASAAYRHLNGLLCLHKPAGYSVKRCLEVVRHKLTQDLNTLGRPPALSVAERRRLAAAVLTRLPPGGAGETAVPGGSSEPALSRDISDAGQLTVSSDSSDVELPDGVWRQVTGPQFLPADIRLFPLVVLGRATSGLLLVGLNDGARLAARLRRGARQVRAYQLTGRLGVHTDSLLAEGRLLERATYGHVSRARLEAVCSGLQAAHQRHMYNHTGAHINSDAAYRLAAGGLVRPAAGSPPLLYCIRCLAFSPPFFTLEVQAIGETEEYLLTLVQDLGRQLRTAAATVALRCVRHGPFTTEHALLLKHWRLAQVTENITNNWHLIHAGRLLEPPRPLLEPAVQQSSSTGG